MGTRPLIPAAAAAFACGLAAAASPLPLGAATRAEQRAQLTFEVDARSVQPGELVVLTVAGAKDGDAVRVRALGKPVQPFRLDDARWRALVGIDLDVKPGSYAVSADAGGAHATRELVVRPKTFRTRRLTVNPDFVTPPPSAEAQIEADAKLLAHTWESSAAERLWTTPFTRPVQDAANSAFGSRSVFNGVPRNAHGGADFLSPAGTIIHSPNAGRVLIARELYFSGNTVIIDHGLGLFSMLAHLSAFDVHEGDSIENQAVVGRVGATGRVTGPHLHWAIRANGARVDPLSLLAVLGKPAE